MGICCVSFRTSLCIGKNNRRCEHMRTVIHKLKRKSSQSNSPEREKKHKTSKKKSSVCLSVSLCAHTATAYRSNKAISFGYICARTERRRGKERMSLAFFSLLSVDLSNGRRRRRRCFFFLRSYELGGSYRRCVYFSLCTH